MEWWQFIHAFSILKIQTATCPENTKESSSCTQGDIKVQVWACIQVDYTNLEIVALDLTFGYKYWWNDDTLSMPFSLSKNELSREHQGNLELDTQGDIKAQVWACNQLGYTNLKMEALDLTIGCKYWWNDDAISMPFSWQKCQQMAFEHQGNLE